MSKRIRYAASHSQNNDSVVSSNFTLSSGSEVKIFITASLGRWEIVRAGDGSVVSTGVGPSVSQLKIKAKKALIDLGYVFENETRSTAEVA